MTALKSGDRFAKASSRLFSIAGNSYEPADNDFCEPKPVRYGLFDRIRFDRIAHCATRRKQL